MTEYKGENFKGMRTWRWKPEEYILVNGIPHVYSLLWLGSTPKPTEWSDRLGYVIVRPYTRWLRSAKDGKWAAVTKPVSANELVRKGHNVVLPKKWRLSSSP